MKTFWRFISQPMKDKTEIEVMNERKNIIIASELKARELAQGENYIIEDINSWITKDPPVDCNIGMWYLARSIDKLAEHPAENTIAVFGGDWKNARGCRIEYETALAYGCNIIEV